MVKKAQSVGGRRIALVPTSADQAPGSPAKSPKQHNGKEKQGKHATYGPAVWELVKKMMGQGMGRVKIAKKLGMPEGSVGYIVQKLKLSGGQCSRKKGSGRPRTQSTPVVIEAVKARCVRNRMEYVARLTQKG